MGATNCSGACANTMFDPANCGMCGHACAAGQACFRGMCACGPGQMRCMGACVNILNDPNNCGGCGTMCTAMQTCRFGMCIP
jgi:hypothetical protein